MHLRTVDRIELPPAADMHVHMRHGDLMKLVAPTVRQGGVDTAFVVGCRIWCVPMARYPGGLVCRIEHGAVSDSMLTAQVPPLTTVERVLEYKSELEAAAPGVNFLMSLFLHPTITPEVIAQASAAGITGVKLYPQGVTTNSDAGVADMKAFYDTFAAMEKHDMVLNIHGEVLESLAPPGTTLEEAFLPTLKSLHERFPKLRIILEHCSTAAAVEAVKACGPTVAATITAHHLYLTETDACCDPFAFCKPIPKKPTDRDVLVRTVAAGDPKFFFGSDSAPHLRQTKTDAAPGKAPAGVFTQPFATQLVVRGLQDGIARGVLAEDAISEATLANFLSHHGRAFYKLPAVAETSTQKIVLVREGATIPPSVRSADGRVEVGNSRAGDEVFTLKWEER
ncbi:dihydroorotase [Sporothrix brasiliensis 5110]|uniref:dihydroorotase n=1 Tax=Sporothrix brasiliensis 5110 TaxID=1398154 RepID=A0A0C2F798_9PEZI|nr:dihydroorotase [Sporothrix brasiliensis 5110]KIH94839.1 dihydroorotase [Sporothrix brasiliensis 5110]